ncbi:MAG: formimidoylglutamate deiminase [bacterium]
MNILQKNDRLILPGLASAHSHAFQRALRGRTQRKAGTAGSFWTWRGLMYELAGRLQPEDIFNISTFAFVELAMSGVTAVGEFHYLHHAPDGSPYSDRTLLADTVIAAAKEAGIRITLLRTAYLRAGYQQELTPAQKRFRDPSVDVVLQDVETLAIKYQADPMVRVALAAHSIRAVPVAQTKELAEYARQRGMPFHMHVAEQRREIAECQQEYGLPPITLLAREGVLQHHFVGIHATHLTDQEMDVLAEAHATICLCRTTERDLGDGLPQTVDLIQAGVKICVGVDSHACSDAFEEMRAVELDERSRTEARAVAAEAPDLLHMGTVNGFEAIGMAQGLHEDRVALNAHDPSIAAGAKELRADAIVFGASPRAVQEVSVAGKVVVRNGWHVKYEQARRGYEATLKRLGLV